MAQDTLWSDLQRGACFLQENKPLTRDLCTRLQSFALDGLHTLADGPQEVDMDRYMLCQRILQRFPSHLNNHVQAHVKLVRKMLANALISQAVVMLTDTHMLIQHHVYGKNLGGASFQFVDCLSGYSLTINDDDISTVAVFLLAALDVVVASFKAGYDIGVSNASLTKVLSSDSPFGNIVLSQPKSQVAEVIKNLIQLSVLTKTAHRLSYLLLAMSYGVHTGQINHDLLSKIRIDCLKMMERNESVVYKLTAQHLYELLTVMRSKGVSTGLLEPIFDKFSLISKTLKTDTLDWNLFQCPLDATVSGNKSLDNLRDLCAIFNKLKTADFNAETDQKDVLTLLDAMHSFFASSPHDPQKVLGLFDFITIQMKGVVALNWKFVARVLPMLANILAVQSPPDKKRLGNVATLYFYFGTKMAESGDEQGIVLLKASAKIEFVLLNTFGDYVKFANRMNQIAHSLVTNNLSDAALPFLMRALEAWYDKFHNGEIMTLDAALQANMSTTLKLLTKALSKCSHFELMIENFKYPDLCIATLVNVIEMLTASALPNKDSLISRAILDLKASFNDNGLFLYFLSKIFFVIEFNINFKSDEFEFEQESISYPIRSLVLAHLNSLTLSINGTTGQLLISSLKKVKHNVLCWLKERENQAFSQYEFAVLETVVNTFKYHSLYTWGVEILELYLSANLQLGTFKGKLEASLARLYLSCYQFDNFKKLTQSPLPDLVNDPFVTVETMISSLEYSILKNAPYAEENIIAVYNILQTDSRFAVSNQKDKYVVVELLLMLARFSHVAAKYFRYITNDYVECVLNLKREVKILQSIMKNFILPSDKAPKFSMNFKCTLKLAFSENIMEAYSTLTDTLFRMGSCKEFEYYFTELEAFAKAQPSSIVQYKLNAEFTKHHVSLNHISCADTLFQELIGTTLNFDGIADDMFKLSVFSTLETFYNFKGERISAGESAEKFDHLMHSLLLSSSNQIDREHLSSIWLDVIGRRLNTFNSYQSTIWIDYFQQYGDKHAAAYVLYEKCMNLLLRHPHLNGWAVSYPFSNINIDEEDQILSEIVNSLRSCSSVYSRRIQSNFQKTPVDVLQSDIGKMTNCFINLARFNPTTSNIHTVLETNDQFKYLPFIYEKQLSQYGGGNNDVLPEKRTLMRKPVQPLKTNFILLREILPQNWAAVSIDYSSATNSLTITRYEYSCDPVVFEISLNRKTSFETTILGLEDIIRQSEITTSTEVTSKVSTKEHKIEWWDTRKKLDLRMKDLLATIENEWLGGFCSLFSVTAANTTDVTNLKQFVEDWLAKTLDSPAVVDMCDKFSDKLFQLLLNVTNITRDKVKDILNIMFDSMVLKFGPLIEKVNLNRLSVELVKRIQLLSSQKKEPRFDHVFIIPGPESVSIPWESIPCLRNISVSRFPTVQHLIERLKSEKSLIRRGVSSENGYYVINPGGDLIRTEQVLGSKFKELATWKGTVGEKPLEHDILSSFTSSNLYIYAGHGGGEQYVRSSMVKQQYRIPPSLLFGCSSGKLKNSLFPHGTPYNYIMGGCPSLLVNLWDVTDKDTDLFTMAVLKEWGLLDDEKDLFAQSPCKPLGQCIATGRDVCKLKYLNGAAPVLYGLPLALSSD